VSRPEQRHNRWTLAAVCGATFMLANSVVAVGAISAFALIRDA
jgi:hypothetical protein